MTARASTSVALEDFIQAVQSQLDTAQARMALKAQNDRLPLTFAIRDISMDLKAHVEMQRGEVRIRPAGPSEPDASVLHLVFTAITKPMIDENAVQLAVEDKNEMPLDEFDDTLNEEERRRLEWIGVRTVSKLDELRKSGLGRSVGRITNLPVAKLESVLARASRPTVEAIEPDTAGANGEALRQRLRLRGRNLMKDGAPARVMVAGRPVSVVRASETELLLAPAPDQFAGQMSLAHDPRASTDFWFDETNPPSGEGRPS